MTALQKIPAQRIVRAIASAAERWSNADFPPRVRRQVNVKPENIARVVGGLYDVVNQEEGTAFWVRDSSLDIAGKTGTAQTGYHAKQEDDPKVAWYRSRDHAWFASFAPSKAPEIAVVVLVEHGESGPKTAAPVAMKVYQEYFKLQSQRAGHGGPSAKSGAPAAPKPAAGAGGHP